MYNRNALHSLESQCVPMHRSSDALDPAIPCCVADLVYGRAQWSSPQLPSPRVGVELPLWKMHPGTHSHRFLPGSSVPACCICISAFTSPPVRPPVHVVTQARLFCSQLCGHKSKTSMCGHESEVRYTTHESTVRYVWA